MWFVVKFYQIPKEHSSTSSNSIYGKYTPLRLTAWTWKIDGCFSSDGFSFFPQGEPRILRWSSSKSMLIFRGVRFLGRKSSQKFQPPSIPTCTSFFRGRHGRAEYHVWSAMGPNNALWAGVQGIGQSLAARTAGVGSWSCSFLGGVMKYYYRPKQCTFFLEIPHNYTCNYHIYIYLFDPSKTWAIF